MDIVNLEHLTAVDTTTVKAPDGHAVNGGFNSGELYFAFSIGNGKIEPKPWSRPGVSPPLDNLADFFCESFGCEWTEFEPAKFKANFDTTAASFVRKLPNLWSVSGGGNLAGNGIFAYSATITRT